MTGGAAAAEAREAREEMEAAAAVARCIQNHPQTPRTRL
jgi:hypothetical protein